MPNGRRAAAALALAAGALLVLPVPAATAAPTDTLTLSGTDQVTGSPSTVQGGDAVRYVAGAANNTSGSAQMQLTDVLPQQQTLAHGSVVTPPGYAVQYSTDGGATYTNTEPASGVTAIRTSGTDVAGSTGGSVSLPTPAGTITTNTSKGDGYQVIFFNGRVYNVHHHITAGNELIDCHVQANGSPCPSVTPGYSAWPDGGFSLGTALGTRFFYDTNTAYVPGQPITSNNPFSYLDRATGRLYVPVGIYGQQSAGLLCANLVTETSCGYTQLYAPSFTVGQTGTAREDLTTGIAGGATVGTRFFTVGAGGAVYCAAISAGAVTSCTGVPAAFLVAQPLASVSFTDLPKSASSAQIRRFDVTHLFLDYPAGTAPAATTYVGCVNVSTVPISTCGGFSVPAIASNDDRYTQLLPVLNAAGVQTGICAPSRVNANGGACFDMMGAPMTDPYPLPAAFGGATQVQWGWVAQGTPAVLGAKVYYTVVAATTTNGVRTWREQYTCHDFAAAANTICAGFAATALPLAGATSPGGGPLRAYTVTSDPADPNCLWTIGDKGIVDVVNGTTGVSAYANGSVPGCVPAASANATLSVTPAQFYCDGASGHTRQYGDVSLAGLPAGYQFTGTLRLTDQTNATVLSRNVTQADFPFDLSAYSTTSITELHATLSMQTNDTAPWTTGQPAMQMTFDGDPPQTCYTANTADNCGQVLGATLQNEVSLLVDGVTDTATYTFAPYLPSATCPALAGTLSLAVAAPAGPVSHVGDPVSYVFAVTNNSNSVVSNVTITDVQTSSPGATLSSGPTCPSGPVAIGASITCTGTYRVTQADLDSGHVTNRVTAAAAAWDGTPVGSNTVTSSVPATQRPQLTVVASVTKTTVTPTGTRTDVTFRVTNTGNVTVTGVNVPFTPQPPPGAVITAPHCPATTLAPGRSMTCTGFYVVQTAAHTRLAYTGVSTTAELLDVAVLAGTGAVLAIAGRRRRRT